MKKFLTLFIIVIIVGVLFFASAYWLFHMSFRRSIGFTISSAIGGLGGIFLKDYFEKRKKKRIIK